MWNGMTRKQTKELIDFHRTYRQYVKQLPTIDGMEKLFLDEASKRNFQLGGLVVDRNRDDDGFIFTFHGLKNGMAKQFEITDEAMYGYNERQKDFVTSFLKDMELELSSL